MYMPIFGKPFRQRVMRTAAVNATDTAINMMFQRTKDGARFKDDNPDFMREEELKKPRPTSPSKILTHSFVFEPSKEYLVTLSVTGKPPGYGRFATDINDKASKRHTAVHLGKSLLMSSEVPPRKPIRNTVSSLLSTGMHSTDLQPTAKVGKGLYFGKPLRPTSAAASTREPVQPTGVSGPSFPSRRRTACSMRGDEANGEGNEAAALHPRIPPPTPQLAAQQRRPASAALSVGSTRLSSRRKPLAEGGDRLERPTSAASLWPMIDVGASGGIVGGIPIDHIRPRADVDGGVANRLNLDAKVPPKLGASAAQDDVVSRSEDGSRRSKGRGSRGSRRSVKTAEALSRIQELEDALLVEKMLCKSLSDSLSCALSDGKSKELTGKSKELTRARLNNIYGIQSSEPHWMLMGR